MTRYIEATAMAVRKVAAFWDVTAGNDPCGARDSGGFAPAGRRFP